VNKIKSSGSKGKKKKATGANNFLEALRSLGGGVANSATQEVAGKIPESILDQLTGRKKAGELTPNQTLSLEEIKPKEEPKPFRPESFGLHRQEKLVYSRADQETQLQIAAILEELKKLSQSTQLLTKEVDIAAKQAPVEPGVYHLNFFEKLKRTIILLRQRIDESRTWLSAFNQRAKRRNYYWAQFKKSGTKFLLSPDRYLATQTG